MNYMAIKKCDIANGTGIRLSLFVSGCPHHCPQCFNQEAWEFNAGKPFTDKEYNAIITEIKKPYYNGITLLGGEPFAQNKEGLQTLIKLCKEVHLLNKNVWGYSGYTFEELKAGTKEQRELLENCDVLVDGKFEIDKKDITLPFRGSSNQRIIYLDNK